MSPPSTEPVRSLATEIDEVARTAPNTPWVYLPRNNDLSQGYQAVTFGQLANSINKMARWIEKNIGISKTKETIAYMDRTNDIRYVFAIVASIKTGHKILLTSTRNSTEGQQFLIQKTDCKVFLHGAESKADVDNLRGEKTQFKSLQIPTLEELLQGDAEPYPGTVSHDPMDSVIIIHTSGSTGLPKPIELRNGWLAHTYIQPTRAADGRQNLASVFYGAYKSLCTLPFFHAMGLLSIVKSIFNKGPLVLPPVGRSPNAEVNLEMIQVGKPDVGFFPPSILEDLVDTPGGLDALHTIEFIMFAGAPLAQEAGDKISRVAKIQTIIGSTEAGILDSYMNEDPSDWMYFEWCPWTGTSMEPQGELHELVLKNKGHIEQGVFFTFPELEEWRTKDLYAEHPKRKGLWQYKGRNDDVIVLSNGEKFNPIEFEKFIESHRDVKGALVVGQGHFQAGLVIELNKNIDPADFIEEIWPRVDKANHLVAAHGRVWKSKIAIAKWGREFVRTPKGSIVRRKTNDEFKDAIEALYSNEGFADQLGTLDPSADSATVKKFILQAIGLTLPKVPADIDESADIFEFGVDSLQVLGLASALSSSMPDGKGDQIKSRTIYKHSNVKSLTEAVLDILSGDGDKNAIPRDQKITESVKKFTANLPAPVKYNPRPDKHAVILTGSTGSLGGYLLEILIKAPDVAKVYCLNRSNAEDRQRKSFEERGAKADFSKVKFLRTSFDHERFGLSEEEYAELQENADIFIHNAWAVNFNMDLDSFEPTHVAGTRRIVDFSASSQYHPHIIFLSSIASTGCWTSTGHTGLVPEVWLEDDNLPLPQGYGESKHVASRILALAAKESNIPASVVRVGQLAGPTAETGCWNKQEWLPSIVSSSKAIGKIPRTLGNQDVVDWVPVDRAAQVLVDIAKTRLTTQQKQPLDIFALVNPNIVNWSELVPAVQAYYEPKGVKLEVVEFEEWLGILKSLPMSQEEVQRVPGLKLLDFYEGLSSEGGLPRMATVHTEASSPTLASQGPISNKLMTNWLNQWNF